MAKFASLTSCLRISICTHLGAFTQTPPLHLWTMWWQRRVLQRTKLGCTRGMLVPPTNYMHPSPTRFAHALHPLRWALLVRWLLQRLSSLLRSQNAQRRQAHLMCHGFAMCSLRMLAPLRAVRPLSEGPRCSAALVASSNAACGAWRFFT